MLVQLNGERRELRDRSTLADLVSELSLAPARIAVELNQKVVRRDQWSQATLAEGDRIEIVHFVGGGSINANASVSEVTTRVLCGFAGAHCGKAVPFRQLD